MVTITVIVPVYNAERYLVRCVESIINQTYKDFELILVNDGSTDNSDKICTFYSEKYANIRVLYQENKGQAAARNKGIKSAEGEWIAFIDADDIIHPQYLEILLEAAILGKTKISACEAYEGDCIPVDFNKVQYPIESTYTVNDKFLYSCLVNENEKVSNFLYWVVWGKLIHKSLLLDTLFTENRIYEDNAIVCKWLYSSGMVTYCNNTMYFYYINPSGTTKKKYNIKRLDWLWAVQEQISFYSSIGYNKIEIVLRKKYIWEALREYYNVTAELKNNRIARKLRRHIIMYCLLNKRKISISYDEKMEILSRLYPTMISMLSRLNRKLRG